MTDTLSFAFRQPVDVRFGRGRRHEVGALLRDWGVRSALVVTDPGLASTPLLAGITEAIEAAGIAARVFSDVEGNPTVEQTARGLAAGLECGAEAVVGAGGGSSMDVAKAVAVLARNPGPITRYDGGAAVPEAGLPLIAIPTTAGTGSEVTPFANYSDKARGYKFAVGHPRFFATAALVDPEATLGLPAPITAATGMDALAHAIECYTARTSHPASEVLALRAIELIGGNLHRAVRNGGDIDAREAVLLGSTLAGMAFVSTRLGVLHALAMPLGGATDLPHGMILAALFVPGLRFNLPASPDRYRAVAAALGAGGDAAEAVERLREELDIPARLPARLDRETLEDIADASMRSVNVRCNPATMTRKAMIEILHQVVEVDTGEEHA